MTDIKTRVEQFNRLELPGQPRMMHMGTSYLVNDMWKELERLRKAISDAYPTIAGRVIQLQQAGESEAVKTWNEIAKTMHAAIEQKS